MTIVSKYFDPQECADSNLFHFSQGIPGFEAEHSFAAIEVPAQWPLVYLQSMSRPDLCLITFPVRNICPEFELDLLPEDAALLGFPAAAPRIGEDVLCLAIVSVEEGREPVANLLAPLVVNIHTHEAVQAIQADSSYTCDYPLPC